VTWKRYNDFKKLHKAMLSLHKALHRREEFPPFVKAQLFSEFLFFWVFWCLAAAIASFLVQSIAEVISILSLWKTIELPSCKSQGYYTFTVLCTCLLFWYNNWEFSDYIMTCGEVKF